MIVEMTPDRAELSELVRRFVGDRASLSDTHGVRDDARDAVVWKKMAGELGLQGLAIPEEHGGAGCGVVELGVVMEQLGSQLYNGPFFSSVCLATPLILHAGAGPRLAEVLESLAAGEVTATVAFAEAEAGWDGRTSTTTWRRDGDTYLVSGAKSNVIDGAAADYLVVTAAEAGGAPDALSLFLVDGGAAGVERQDLPTLDQTRSLCRLDLNGVTGALVGAEGAAGPIIERLLQEASVLLAAEQLGGAQHCLDESVKYAGTREQFGRAIGSFQSVKHACADTLADIETARSAVLYALAAVDSGANPREAASLARAHCSDVFQKAASTYVHILGGIGFTWEHEAHLYLKRALGSRAILGSPSEHREIVAQEIGL